MALFSFYCISEAHAMAIEKKEANDDDDSNYLGVLINSNGVFFHTASSLADKIKMSIHRFTRLYSR